LKVFLLQFLLHLTFFPINKQQPTDYIFKLLGNNILQEQPYYPVYGTKSTLPKLI
jgi:hypothetical protein